MMENDALIPIMIGVTGHRDIADTEALKKHVITFLEEILKKYPQSPITVMSALAVGADRVVAKAVLELREDYGERINLMCPLPLPVEEYRHDWSDEASDEFEFLLEKCNDSFDLPLSYGGLNDAVILDALEKERDNGNQFTVGSIRNKRYALVGSYIARHSHILLAIWDTKRPKKEGGTAWVVDDFRHGCSLAEARKEYTGASYNDVMIPDVSPLKENSLGAVYHISCGQTGGLNSNWMSSSKASETVSCSSSFPKTINYLDDMNEFNRLVADGENQAAYGKALGYFNIGKKVESPSNICDAFDGSEKKILGKFACVHAAADAFAIDVQKKAFWQYIVLSAVGFFALFFFVADDRLDIGVEWKVAFFVLAAITMILKYWFVRDANNITHLRYRSLAEGLRVQAAWFSAGLQLSVIDAYPYKYEKDLGWVKHALRGLHAGAKTNFQTSLNSERIDSVKQFWIEDQKSFIQGKIEGKSTKQKYLPQIQGYKTIIKYSTIVSTLFFRFSFIIAILVMLSGFLSVEWVSELGQVWGLFFIVLPLSFSIAIERYVQGMGLREELEWYQTSVEVYEDAIDVLNNPDSEGNPEQRANILFKLGFIVLHENVAWIDLHQRNDLFHSVHYKD